MSDVHQVATPLEAPAGSVLLEAPGDWLPVAPDDPAIQHISAELWPGEQPPAGWEVARLSAAVFIYREVSSSWTVTAKYYSVKTGLRAPFYSEQEYELTQQAGAALGGGDVRAVEALSVWRGVLFLEYVTGLTLEDTIAVRRNRPGTLLPALDLTATLLAQLHHASPRPDSSPDFGAAVEYTLSLVDTLAVHGVLQDDPILENGLRRAIRRWAANPVMGQYDPVFTHGDATTTNFIFPWEGGIVGIDWERAKLVDPAADLGRLLAEVAHGITRYGGSVAEAQALTDRLRGVYCRVNPDEDTCPLEERVRFYHASSTLRIARNGWLSRHERTSLAARALALLT